MKKIIDFFYEHILFPIVAITLLITISVSGQPITGLTLLMILLYTIAITLVLQLFTKILAISILLGNQLYKIIKENIYEKYGINVEFDTTKYPDLKLENVLDELKRRKIKHFNVGNSNDFYDEDLEIMLHKIGYVYQFYFMKKQDAAFFKLKWG